MQTMRVEINEMAHAFRVNGVTLAKRHLQKTLGNGCKDSQELLFKYLTIVPFLTEVYQIPDKASPSVRYGALKAKRIYQSLGLSEENTEQCVAFMLFCIQQSGFEPTLESIRHLGPAISRAFGARSEDVKPSFPAGNRGNVINFQEARANRTLH